MEEGISLLLAHACLPVISALKKMRLEDCHKLGASLSYIESSRPAKAKVESCLKRVKSLNPNKLTKLS